MKKITRYIPLVALGLMAMGASSYAQTTATTSTASTASMAAASKDDAGFRYESFNLRYV